MNNAYYKAWPEELRGQPWILPVQYSYTRMVNRKEIIDFITNRSCKKCLQVGIRRCRHCTCFAAHEVHNFGKREFSKYRLKLVVQRPCWGKIPTTWP